MADSGEKYVGREIVVPASYFDDIADVIVEKDFILNTKIIGYIHDKRLQDRRWVFRDHEGEDNHVGFDLLKEYINQDLSDNEDLGVEEHKGITNNYTLSDFMRIADVGGCSFVILRGLKSGGDILSESGDFDGSDEGEDSDQSSKYNGIALLQNGGRASGAGVLPRGGRGGRGNVAPKPNKIVLRRISWGFMKTKPAVEHPFGIDPEDTGYQKRNADVNKAPVDYFLSFITNDIVNIAIQETNRYATKNDRANWKPVTKAELYTFIGLQVFMGVVNVPELDMYAPEQGRESLGATAEW